MESASPSSNQAYYSRSSSNSPNPSESRQKNDGLCQRIFNCCQMIFLGCCIGSSGFWIGALGALQYTAPITVVIVVGGLLVGVPAATIRIAVLFSLALPALVGGALGQWSCMMGLKNGDLPVPYYGTC